MKASAVKARPPPEGSSPLSRFEDVRAWVFDLDNTLYPAHVDVYPQVEQRIRDYVQRLLHTTPGEAHRIQKEFQERFGATLTGLVAEYGVSPDDFLEYVHDIDHSSIQPDKVLAESIALLPGKKYILTNGSRRHAEKVGERLGITDEFEEIFDIAWAGHLPKPSPQVYDRLLVEIAVEPHAAALFEDLTRNLIVPRRLGMVTTLVVPPGTREVVLELGEDGPGRSEADFVTDNLGAFLGRVLARLRGVSA
ncbi:MAG: pyrimidine 5'-nucleotidase [Bauldia sp.]|nr:pyrimidine 5'-nucleotidase [Bauldia sp.]